jgi:hypothetical protein
MEPFGTWNISRHSLRRKYGTKQSGGSDDCLRRNWINHGNDAI